MNEWNMIELSRSEFYTLWVCPGLGYATNLWTYFDICCGQNLGSLCGPFLTEPCSFPTFLCRSSSMWPHGLRFAPATIEWLVFWRWLALWALLRFCCPALWTLLIFGETSVPWHVAIHMTSQTVTYLRDQGVDWRPLFACMPLALPHVLMPEQLVEVWCQHLNGGTQALMAWCVSLLSLHCFAEDLMYGLMSLAFSNAVNCQWLQPLPCTTWVMGVFLPTSALLCITCRVLACQFDLDDVDCLPPELVIQ